MAIEFPFRFNQTYQPGSIPQFGAFGPANISNQLQTGISKFLDPMLARLKELEVANHAEAIKRGSGFLNPAAPTTTSTTTPDATAKAPGVLGTPSAPFVNPAAASGSGGGTFQMGQGMDPSTGEPTPGGPGTVPGSPLLQAAKIGIAGVETGGKADPYSTWGQEITKKDGSKDIAVGKYQVMASNVGPWTEKWLGQRMTPDEFRNNPEAQERVFEGEFGSYLDKHGNLKDAASMWFSGRTFKQAVAAGAKDININVPEYVRRVYSNIQKAGGIPEPKSSGAPTASFAPPVNPAPTPAAAAAVGAPESPIGPLPRREGTPLPINPPLAGGPNTAPQQTAANPDMVGGQRQAAPEIGAPRPVRTQALGPDGQPLPPSQQPANPLPTGGGTSPQPNPPPPPPAQPPPPPIPAVAPPPPVAQAQAADVVLPPDVPVEHMALPATPRGSSPAPAPRVDPSVTPAPPVRVAGGVPVPLPQAPARMPPQRAPVVAPQQPAVQRRLAPIDPQAEQFLLNAYRLARTPEDVYKIGQDIIKLRQGEKPSVHVTRDGRMIEYHPGSGLTRDVTPPPPGGEVVNPKAWEQAKDLREKFDAEPETRKFRVSQTALNQIRSSAESGTGVGDISLIYQYIKMLDPDTGVREGEIALANQTGSLPDRIVNVYNNVTKGHKLNDKQRKQFVDEASRLLQIRSAGMQEHVDWLTNAAKRAKLNPDDIIRFRPHKFEPWTAPRNPDGSERNDPGGVDEEIAAASKGATEANPIILGTTWEEAQKNAKTPGLSGRWGQWPDGSRTQLR